MTLRILALFLLLTVHAAQSQTADADVARCLGLIKAGQIDAVKAEVTGLLAKYPNNPGVIYLEGLTTQDGAQAVRIYQSVVDNFPKSEWADDALYKVYQFYQSLGLYRTADMKMDQLRADYPASSYVKGAGSAPAVPDEAAASPTPAPKVSETVPSARPEVYTLQVGAYTTAANAQKQRSVFDDLSYPVEVISKVKGGRSLFLVQVGSFETADEAHAAAADIKHRRNIDAIVTTK
jgi:outer membrane protein assembly factor BamD (BamD/ComL family)